MSPPPDRLAFSKKSCKVLSVVSGDIPVTMMVLISPIIGLSFAGFDGVCNKKNFLFCT